MRNYIVAELIRRGDVPASDLSCEVIESTGLVIVPTCIRNEMLANASRDDGAPWSSLTVAFIVLPRSSKKSLSEISYVSGGWMAAFRLGVVF